MSAWYTSGMLTREAAGSAWDTRPVSEIVWRDYLERFHAERAGITETVLRASWAEGVTAYEWLGASLEGHAGVVLDVACGSGPMQPVVGSRWVGLDRSRSELAAARRAQDGVPLVHADAAALPLRAACADVVVCCMGLMVFPSVEDVLAELARVTRPGAAFGVLLPATRPLTVRDRVRYGHLFATLRIVNVSYPNPAVVRDPGGVLRDARFVVKDDVRKRFSFRIADEAAADAFVDSLYLPDVPPPRRFAAKRVMRRWIGTDLGIPLRRVTARVGGCADWRVSSGSGRADEQCLE